MRKTVHYIILFATACLLFAACSRRTTDARRLLACIDSLADVNPDSADMLLRAIPDSALQKGEENLGRVELLLRIKTDDKLYRPVTHYRDTILRLVDYFEQHPKVLPSLLGSTGPALPYLYAGRIFADLGDAPQSLDYYQQALDVQPDIPSPVGEGRGELSLAKQRCLILSQIGEQFYYQELYGNALITFQKALCIAEQTKDTISIIFKCRDIAEQYKFLDKPDSSLWFYERALDYAKESDNSRRQIDITLQIARLNNQLGKYNHARDLLKFGLFKVDSINISATYSIAATTYLGLGIKDSAFFYLSELVKVGNLYGRRFAHRELSEIFIQRGDITAASEQFKQYKLLDDSIQKRENAETVARMHAAYNYQKHKQKTMELELVNAHQKIAMVLIILSSFFILGILYNIFRKRQQRLRKKMQYLQSLSEEMRKTSSEFQEMTVYRISELNTRIQELQRDSQAANQRHQEEMMRLVAEKHQLEFQLKKQKSNEEVKATGMKAIKQSTAYQHFVKLDNQKRDTPSFSDWAELQRCVNLYFPEFERHLKSLCKMSNQQYRACLLRWLGFGPSSTAFLTCYGKSSVSNLYMRLYENIMGKRGTMKEFDELLSGL